MKKIILITLLMIGLSSCDKVDQRNVTFISHGLVLEADSIFESDSTMNVVIIEKQGYNYVFERGKDYPILESFTDYKTSYLAIFILTMLTTIATCLHFILD